MEAKAICALVLLGLLLELRVDALSLKWTALGCYKDSGSNRALEKFLGVATHTDSHLNLFKECKEKAESYGYKFFGVQNEKECWGTNRTTSYDIHGCAHNCKKSGNFGMGQDWSNYVYYNKEQWTSCDCVERVKYKIKLPKINRADCPVYNRIITASTPAKKCSYEEPCAKVDGGWSDFGPWMACDKLCGEGGMQKRVRTCTSPPPSGGGKDCNGSSEIVKSCNTTNCPTPCSFDGLTVQLTGIIGSDVKVNNHMVSALAKVVEAIENSPSIPYLNEDRLIRRIKHSLSHPDGEEKARRLFGVLLSSQDKCNYKRAIKKVKHKIGSNLLKKLVNADGAVSLMFTIDATGSMLPVINQAKDMAKAIAAHGREFKVNYILTVYGEPLAYKLRVRTFDNAKQFIKALDRIFPNGGWDCPEPTYAGIIEAISKGYPKPGSPMYVFTDAPPKAVGKYTKEAAVQYALSSNTKLNFFLMDGKGSCTHQHPQPKDSPEYREIIRATGGVGLSFNNASLISQLKKVVEADLEGSQILSSVAACKETADNMFDKRSYSEHKFDVDDICKSITVFVTGNNAGSGVDLSDSNGRKWSAEISTKDSKTWVILEPRAGNWTFTVGSTVTDFKYEVTTSALLDISFIPKFMKSGSFIPHPLKRDQATVKMDIPNVSRLDESSLKFHLIADDAKELSKKGDLYSSHLPPGNTLSLRMTGKTLSGVDFERQSKTFEPKDGVVRAVTTSRTLEPDENTQFTIAIHFTGSGSKTFSLSAKSNKDGMSMDASSRSVSVSSGGSKEVSFSLRTPSELDGEQVTIMFQARGDNLVLSLPIEFYVESGW